jgi:dienelactone hydrolase
MLAELGYIAFVADPYGDGRMAQDLAEGHARSGALLHDLGELRGRAVAAFDVLAGQAGVDVNTIAAIGYCFGGTCALELARNGANLAALVSFHGSLATTRPAAKAIRPKILICTGSADPLVPLEQIRPFSEEMDRAGCRWRLDLYGGVKHNFTNPDADAIGRPGVGYDESADTNSWRSMCDLFAGTIG